MLNVTKSMYQMAPSNKKTTYLSSLLIISICCCSREAKVCASPLTPLSSDISLPASLSMSESLAVSKAIATFLRTLSCSSFCHSCSFSVKTLLGASSIPARPFVSRLIGSLKHQTISLEMFRDLTTTTHMH